MAAQGGARKHAVIPRPSRPVARPVACPDVAPPGVGPRGGATAARPAATDERAGERRHDRDAAPTVATTRRALAALPFVLLPLAGVVELVAGERQRRAVPTSDDWARAAGRPPSPPARRPGDAIIVAPRWAAPLGAHGVSDGRAIGGGEEARRRDRPSVRPRAPICSPTPGAPSSRSAAGMHGRREGVPARVGAALRLRRPTGFENPSPQRQVRDLTAEVDASATVYRAAPNGAREPCRWEPGGMQRLPSLFTGPTPAAERWLCSPRDAG